MLISKQSVILIFANKIDNANIVCEIDFECR